MHNYCMTLNLVEIFLNELVSSVASSIKTCIKWNRVLLQTAIFVLKSLSKTIKNYNLFIILIYLLIILWIGTSVGFYF